ncbi:MAG: M16 family metallopeptidase [Gammaproteobacteria bacterium]
MLRRSTVLLLAALVSAGLAISARASPTQDVLQATLKNGLRVVIVRNALAPVVTTEMNYLVGSNETPAGFPGTAHAVEHMMFRGGPGLSRDQLAEITAAMGGDFDADTTNTVTQYYFTVPAADVDVALHIAALRMRGVDMSEAEWTKERGAIEQEVARDLSNPQYKMVSQMRAALFKGTPYAHDALGTRPSFNATTARMLKEFHSTWYVPNNAIFVVVGNVDPPKVMAEVKTLFAGIPAKKLPPRPVLKLQPVNTAALHLPTDLPYGLVVMAYRFPGAVTKNYATSQILGDVLASRRGSLYALVPEGKALFAGFEAAAFQRAGMGLAIGIFPRGADATKLSTDMQTALAGILKNGVAADLVAAAKRQEIAQLEFQKNSVSGLANAWSQALAFQGLESPDDMRARFEAVTVADVNRAAREYLDSMHLITAVMTPESSGAPVASKGFGGSESFNAAPEKAVPLPTWASDALARLEIPKSNLQPIETTLANGIRLIVQPTDVSDTVSVYGRIRNTPDLQTPKGQEGVSDVLDGLFEYGTTSLNRLAFQAALDDIAASESAGTGFSVQVPAAHFERAVQLLADNELHPALPESAFNVVRMQMARAQMGLLQSPDFLFQHALTQALVPENDPTLRVATPESIMGVTLADVQAYYQSAFRPDLTTIVVIGKITPAAAKSVVGKYFGGWKASGPKPDTVLAAIPANPPSTAVVPDRTSVQDTVTLAQTLGVTLKSPDRYALALGNEVLGQGFYASRLYRDLREKTGLVYTVSSSFDLTPTRGVFAVSYGCDPDKVAQARAIVIRDLTEMQESPVTAVELERAKALALRGIPLREASVGSIARGWLSRSVNSLPLDEPLVAARHFMDLTATEVQAAYKQWLRPQGLVEVVKGPTPK